MAAAPGKPRVWAVSATLFLQRYIDCFSMEDMRRFVLGSAKCNGTKEQYRNFQDGD
jgi:hypothetical protein